MEEKKLTGFAVITAIFLIVFIAVCMLCSCSTKQKTITEYVTVHDTIRTHKTDTLREVSYQVRVDTVRQVESHYITLNNVGDTIKEIHHYHDSEKVIVVDSTDRYKAVVDSLRSALTSEQNKYKEIVKTKHVIRWWEWLLIIGIVLSLIYGVKQIKN
jgi:hypothetical protein